jgi:hypothetical protein
MRENPTNVVEKAPYELFLKQIEMATNTSAKLSQNQQIILDNVVRHFLSPVLVRALGPPSVVQAQQIAMWLNTCHR